ncbi:sensor histidine kinase [Pseudoxanthomonas koreensis]|uniref:sensor histidine kinase n=1 Tax=Pseudoxanthomonas koreensis TaxID=266061 RepID=UPI0035A63C7C
MSANWSALRSYLGECWVALRSRPRRVAVVAAPWLLGLLVGLPLLWYEVDRAVSAPERQAGHDAVQGAARSILRWAVRLRDDTRFLANVTPRLAEDGWRPDSALAHTYTAFLLAGGEYHKVRWIDAGGMEQLRLDQDRGHVYQVRMAALQDKSGRPFFEHGLRLQPGQVHLSPLDLNVENGRIEQPLRPTLRAAAPFVMADGSTGVAVVNVHGEILLQRLREQARQDGFHLYLVHPQGGWLIGPEPGDAWGWLLGSPERTVEKQYPELWRLMQRQPSGHWRNWSFSTLHASWGGADGDLLAHADPSVAGLRVLVHRPAPSQARWKAIMLGLAAVGTVLVLLVVMGQARGLAREAAYVRRLRQANDALALANEHLQVAQHDLARAERLSSLGLMVAGVAHEMNTPLASARLALSTVDTGVEALQQQLRSGLRRSELDAFLDSARAACDLADGELKRASALVQRFKQVAVDRASLEKRRFDLAEVVLDADPRLRRGEPIEGIVLELELEPGVAMDSYPGPLEQVVSNLLGNALLHGYPDGGPGRVRVSAHADGPGQVRIEVADAGRGIDPEHRAQVFEPFFTTRRNRGGTGLGLHIVHQIVTEVLGGRIEIGSAGEGDAGAAGGTVFIVRVPRVGPDRPVVT